MTDKPTLKQLQESSYLSGGNASYIDELYENYLSDPQSVASEWRDYFNRLPTKGDTTKDVSHEAIRNYFLQYAKSPVRKAFSSSGIDLDKQKKQAHVFNLINAYRSHGHHQAHLDPLNMIKRPHIDDLELSQHHLSDADLDSVFSTESALTPNGSPLRVILQILKRTYSDTLGVEYMHISDPAEVAWIEQRLESVQSHPPLSAEEKKQILEGLTEAEGLEKYLGSKYVGQKRFSLEGGDSFIPLLQKCIQSAGAYHVKEMVIGMAHRGRLNVLINILGKTPSDLFSEFEGKFEEGQMSGDVKYHKGFSSDIKVNGDELHLTMAFNPSHLEIIDPVVEGSVRARQQRRGEAGKDQVVPILVHGDAAFSGQGVVMETMNFSQARGYSTGGTVHVVINNQIGFTTSDPLDSRSTLYCTDVAKMVQAPVFHVNGDDPEMVVFAAQLAFDFRMKFKKDVVIDLVCYRRHGHNEADDPSITQPLMYANIRSHATVRDLYAQRLMAENVIDQASVDAMIKNYRDKLDAGQAIVKTFENGTNSKLKADWTPFLNEDWQTPAKTSISKQTLTELAKELETLPEGFTLHPQVEKLFVERHKMTLGELPINWGYAETMAYASLLKEGYLVRLAGQDSGRGTFAHRQAVLYDYKNGHVYVPLEHISSKPQQFTVIDSILSEEAVLGFEYGFACAQPNGLILWEAQFGDFANGAQVVIDQFISSGEQKWGRLCALTMLLPHGYEGQGPEHSSARLERYLQLCAQHNIQVCVLSTPAQCFHMLRRQMIRPYRKPLIVMTPKSLLRHKLAVSTVEDLTNGKFQLVIPEIDELNTSKVRRVVVCSGKVYYDLLQQRRDNKQTNVAIIRVEQLYPFPEEALSAVFKAYKNAKEIIWCQEEPKNQGAWYAILHHLEACLLKGQSLTYVGRGDSASPAVGSNKLHVKEQQGLVNEALSL